jgi:CRISPR/Cas system-associated endonuclease/helicase Cas3
MVAFIEENDEDYVNETIETLEYLIDAPGLKDEELDVIGELLSNFSGAIEVHREIKSSGKSQKDALNEFMKRVTGSIDK